MIPWVPDRRNERDYFCCLLLRVEGGAFTDRKTKTAAPLGTAALHFRQTQISP
jgi:hypothetical protein